MMIELEDDKGAKRLINLASIDSVQMTGDGDGPALVTVNKSLVFTTASSYNSLKRIIVGDGGIRIIRG